MSQFSEHDPLKNSELQRLVKAIRANQTFLVSGHVNPEGDSLGAAVAVAHLLKGMGKRAVCYFNDPPPEGLQFLAKGTPITTRLPRGHFDAGIVVDAPVLERLGRPAAVFGKLSTLISIDHHVSHNGFAHINWVDAQVSSSGEMVYWLHQALRRPISPAARLGIYVAVVTDTGSFRYSNTSAKTHEVAARMVREGIEPRPVSEMIYETSSRGRIKLLADVLDTLRVSRDGRIGWVIVTRAMQKRSGAVPGDTEGFVDFARSLKGVEVAVFFREVLGQKKIKVSFRSKGRADVNRIASVFGGGGHKAASGCELSLPLQEAVRRVIREVRRSLRS